MIIQALGRFLIILGAVVLIVGVLLSLSRHIPVVGRLPGDICYQKGSLRIYLPLTTSLVLSLILTLAANLIVRR
jgi:hypothetical protein